MRIRISTSKWMLGWIALGIFALDFATKWIARIKLEPVQTVDIVPGCLALTYVQNSGVAFGFLNNIESAWKPYALSVIAAVAVITIALYFVRIPRSRFLLQLALAVTTGGILGNSVDRLLRGYVIDFIDFHIRESFHWPAFNVADSAITIGIALLLLDAIKQSAENSRQSTVGSRQ